MTLVSLMLTTLLQAGGPAAVVMPTEQRREMPCREVIDFANLDNRGYPDRILCFFIATRFENPPWPIKSFDRVLLDIDGAVLGWKGDAIMDSIRIADIDAKDDYQEVALSDYGASDDYVTYFFRYADREISFLGEVPGLFRGLKFDHAGTIATSCRGHVLHTWFYPCEFKLGGSGQLEEVAQSWKTMNSRVALKADLELCGGPGSPQTTAVLRTGEQAVIQKTDDDEWFFIVSERGVSGWFRLEDALRKCGCRFGSDLFDGLNMAD